MIETHTGNNGGIPLRGHLRATLRICRLMTHVVLGSVIMAVLIPWSRLQGRPTPPTAWWYRGAVQLYGVKVKRLPGPVPPVPSLVVCNHLSWLDIIVLASEVPSVFVSKDGIRNWPLIGWYARQFGTIFLERGKHQTQMVGEAMAQGLNKGVAVVIFPEATTSGYNRPRRFYARLFSGAINAGVPVVPAALAYPDVKRQRMNSAALFVDNEPFLNSVWRVLAQPSTDAELRFGRALPVQGRTRDELAEESHSAVCELLEDILPADDPAPATRSLRTQ